MRKNRWEEIRSALGFWEGNGDLVHEKEKEDEWYRCGSFSNSGMRMWTIILQVNKNILYEKVGGI